ncbi:ABC type multidrug transporter, ATP-binding protein [Candidatus Nitrosymbiomonas proteolyticus]|uniref:ABC type multidrug transporter, ATP-binding protein n=1 Tax=Candidatus Nitrosymbiomonas proteolyticus TaxID=2608984 RepID=A0A809RU34_9BACT|nr:ABC type multidrug transporter, ATP-binding protein [Candidatus Nitrosymbiomonas proteolyticus]
MIELRSASRWYGQVIGLNDVSATISGGVTALLGMNGAGKTTLMRLVTGQMRPTAGEVRVFGEDPFANPSVYRKMGYCPDVDNFYEELTGRQFLNLMGRMSGFTQQGAEKRTQGMLEKVGMADRADRKIGGFSKGMRQRIKLAQAMLHDPEIILLDEPLNGLDPVGRREFIDVLHELGDQGKAILVSSHILFEVEQMTRSILLLHRGRLLATGDLKVIRELIDKHPHRVRIRSTAARQVAEHIVALPYVISVHLEPGGDALELQTREVDQFFQFLPTLALDKGLPLHAIESPDNNLESVFRYLVGG